MDNSKERIIELLAPAGSWEALEAAVNAGADAVYMGGKAFGARQYASNFDREEMAKAVAQLICDKEDRRRRIELSMEYVHKFKGSNLAAQVFDIYKELL